MPEKIKWNGEFGEKCNLPIDCVDCDITECPGRPSEARKWRRLPGILPDTILGSAKVSDGYQISVIKEIRPYLRIQPGDRLQFRLSGKNVIIEKAE